MAGPVVGKMLGLMYPMNPQQWADVDAYTSELEDKIVKLVGASLKSLQPARLSFGHGEASFAMNRRARTKAEMVIRGQQRRASGPRRPGTARR